MTSPIVVGVDPGGKGAFALYRPGFYAPPAPPGMKRAAAPQLMLWDMPTKKVQVSRNTEKTVVDLFALHALAQLLVGTMGAQRVIIEKVGGMPGQGSGFTFGWNTGIVHMAFIAAGIEPETLAPTRWKNEMKLDKDKNKSVFMADELFPAHVAEFRAPNKAKKGAFVVRKDRAEAALIAYWGATHP